MLDVLVLEDGQSIPVDGPLLFLDRSRGRKDSGISISVVMRSKGVMNGLER